MTEQRTIAITTLGCKVNQFESASFISSFADKGLELVPFSRSADIYVINTCAVTARAGAQSRQMIRRALRTNPEARLVVTGCYAQVAPQEVLAAADHEACVVGNGNKHRLVEVAIAHGQCDLEMHMGDIMAQRQICDLPVSRFAGRTRAFLKLQDGCDNFCSYCIVPYARGRSRSLPPVRIFDQLEVFAGQGYQEIVLTGIHVGMYGKDLDPVVSLEEIIREMLGRFPGIRFRLSSLESEEVSPGLLDLAAGADNFMPHLHIPLQSGDDGVLRRMNRRYLAADYRQTISRIREKMADAAIGADVLVGFPGEDEEAFANTYDLLADLPITYLHVFPYSRREGTVAAGMKNQVAGGLKDERVALLRELDRQKRQGFYGKFLGTSRRVLVEGRRNRQGQLRGFTDNYIPVVFAGSNKLENQIVEVELLELTEDGVLGQRREG